MMSTLTNILALVAFTAVPILAVPAPAPLPTGIPSESTARSELNKLTVAAKGSLDGYDRDLFPHWISQGGGCDTRDLVLERDGTNIEVGDDCDVTGSWLSPYDGDTWDDASDVDIDHMVPLANAWVSGASNWTTSQRQTLANDLTHPQLLAVTDNVNQSKGDSGPEEWQPPLESFYCKYAEMWVRVKYVYDLTITADEKSALSDMLDTC